LTDFQTTILKYPAALPRGFFIIPRGGFKTCLQLVNEYTKRQNKALFCGVFTQDRGFGPPFVSLEV
jgi:hypothetical protein